MSEPQIQPWTPAMAACLRRCLGVGGSNSSVATGTGAASPTAATAPSPRNTANTSMSSSSGVTNLSNYRLTVHLPGRQLFVCRAQANWTLTELRTLIEDKRDLGPNKDELLFSAHDPSAGTPPISRWREPVTTLDMMLRPTHMSLLVRKGLKESDPGQDQPSMAEAAPPPLAAQLITVDQLRRHLQRNNATVTTTGNCSTQTKRKKRPAPPPPPAATARIIEPPAEAPVAGPSTSQSCLRREQGPSRSSSGYHELSGTESSRSSTTTSRSSSRNRARLDQMRPKGPAPAPPMRASSAPLLLVESSSTGSSLADATTDAVIPFSDEDDDEGDVQDGNDCEQPKNSANEFDNYCDQTPVSFGGDGDDKVTKNQEDNRARSREQLQQDVTEDVDQKSLDTIASKDEGQSELSEDWPPPPPCLSPPRDEDIERPDEVPTRSESIPPPPPPDTIPVTPDEDQITEKFRDAEFEMVSLTLNQSQLPGMSTSCDNVNQTVNDSDQELYDSGVVHDSDPTINEETPPSVIEATIKTTPSDEVPSFQSLSSEVVRHVTPLRIRIGGDTSSGTPVTRPINMELFSPAGFYLSPRTGRSEPDSARSVRNRQQLPPRVLKSDEDLAPPATTLAPQSSPPAERPTVVTLRRSDSSVARPPRRPLDNFRLSSYDERGLTRSASFAPKDVAF